jgi:hypothetical protein
MNILFGLKHHPTKELDRDKEILPVCEVNGKTVEELRLDLLLQVNAFLNVIEKEHQNDK